MLIPFISVLILSLYLNSYILILTAVSANRGLLQSGGFTSNQLVLYVVIPKT